MLISKEAEISNISYKNPVVVFITGVFMKDEVTCFEVFKNRIIYIDPTTGRIDVKYHTGKGNGFNRIIKDIGSLNPDGYERIHCDGRLCFKHRFLFWFYHGYLPEEVDHIDGNRANNSISNLKASDRSNNCSNKHKKRHYKQLTASDVHSLCKDLLNGMTITDVAKKYNKSRTQIKQIKLKNYWEPIASQYF